MSCPAHTAGTAAAELSWTCQCVADLPELRTTPLLLRRCGPFQPALELLQLPEVRELVHAMTHGSYHIQDGLEAFDMAGSKGIIKVQVTM